MRIAGQPTAPPWYLLCIEILGLLLIVPMVMFTSSIYGLGWAVGIGGLLAEERQRARYDLLCTLPGGPVAVNYGLCRAALHRSRALSRLSARDMWVGRTILIGVVGLFFINDSAIQNSATALLIVVLPGLILLSLVTHFDHVYSTVMSGLVGMLVPTYAANRGDAQLLAFLSFLLLQTVTYTATIMAVMLLFPLFFIAAHLIGLLLYVGLREGSVHLLWHLLAKRLDADSKELDFRAMRAL